MAFADDITLSPDSGTTNNVYSIISMVGGKSIRQDATLELDVPSVLTISHQTTGKGDSAVARRMVRLDRTLEGVDAEYKTVSAHTVLTVPGSVVTKTDVSNLVAELIDFFQSAGFLDKLLNGEP